MAAVSGAEPADSSQLLRPPAARPPGSSAAPPEVRVTPWWRTATAELAPRNLWRHHQIFSALVLLSVVPRVLATLGFRPAMLIADSYQYMQDASPFTLGKLRPSGYPVLLRLLEPLHSLLAITIVQHLLGIGIAVIIYALLRSWGLKGWGSALATVPVLFDPRQIALESYILPDALFGFVIVAVVAILMTRHRPGVWQCALAGLGIAYETMLRGNGLPLIVPILAYLLVRKVGWRPFIAAGLAFAVPVLAYAALFDADYGSFNITNSDGLFLWARTMSFANCNVIKPAADLQRLCPDQQGVIKPASPADYLWSKLAWWIHTAPPGTTAGNNARAMRFALAAIAAQPASYAKVIGKDLAQAFSDNRAPRVVDDLAFTAQPAITILPPFYARYLRDYTGSLDNQHEVRPYAQIMFRYQKYIYLPGLAFLAIMLFGLAGLIRNWRRWGGPGALPWVVSALLILIPIVLSEYLYRYAIVAVPLACLAAALTFAPRPDNSRRSGESSPAIGSPAI